MCDADLLVLGDDQVGLDQSVHQALPGRIGGIGCPLRYSCGERDLATGVSGDITRQRSDQRRKLTPARRSSLPTTSSAWTAIAPSTPPMASTARERQRRTLALFEQPG